MICDSPDESAGDVYLVHDAWRNLFDMALVFSQDTDLIEPVRIVRDEIKKPIGVVVLDGKAPGQFARYGSFVRHISLTDIRNIRQKGTRLGNWLTRELSKELLAVPNRSTLKGKRDYVILAPLVGCAPAVERACRVRRRDHPAAGGALGAGRPRGKGRSIRTRRHPIWVKRGIQRL